MSPTLSGVINELERRGRIIKPHQVRDATFKEQDAFVGDLGRYLAAQCTRRAGKSNGLGLRFVRTMLKHEGCFCPYTALTRESAKNIMWPVLHEIDEKFKLGAKFTESNLTMTLKNGSRLQLFGADMKNFIKRLKGIKTPGAGIDEAQDFGSHLESLVNDVLGPAILDYPDGWLALTGTPGPIPHGYFYDVSSLGKHGFSLHKWSLFDNPYLPGARDFVEDLKRRKAWANDNPTLLREYYNQWVLDLDALVFKYREEINNYPALPQSPNPWRYIFGIDVGYNDADAIAVIGWNERLKETYLVYEDVTSKQGITPLANKIEKLVKKYAPDKIVMDTGGLGKKIAEELRARFQLPILAAEKTRKVEFIELLNDALRTRKFYAHKESLFAQDAARVKWDYEKSTPDKLVISDNFHSDVCDAVLYAYREALHWLYEEEPVLIKPNTPEYFKAQEDDAIERLERELQKSQEDAFFDQDPWDL